MSYCWVIIKLGEWKLQNTSASFFSDSDRFVCHVNVNLIVPRQFHPIGLYWRTVDIESYRLKRSDLIGFARPTTTKLERI